MDPLILQQRIINEVPIGSRQAAVETALRDTFRLNWTFHDLQSPEYLSQLRFTAPIEKGDYRIRSCLADFSYVIGSDSMTATFLFSRDGRLKELLIEKESCSL